MMAIEGDTQILWVIRIHRRPYWLKPVVPNDNFDRLALGTGDRLDFATLTDGVKFTLSRPGLGPLSCWDSASGDLR